MCYSSWALSNTQNLGATSECIWFPIQSNPKSVFDDVRSKTPNNKNKKCRIKDSTVTKRRPQ